MLKIEKQIIKHEGFDATVYECTAGKLTIGYGRNLEDKGITQDEALVLLRNDIVECETDLFKIFGKSLYDLDDNRRHALIDMRYNLGPAGFRKFRRMIAAVKNDDFVLAALEIEESLWYTQVGDRGSTIYDMMYFGDDL